MPIPIKTQLQEIKVKRFERIYKLVIDFAILFSRLKILKEIVLNLITPLIKHSVLLSQLKIKNRGVLKDKIDMMIAVIYSALRAKVNKRTVKVLLKNVFLNQEAKIKREKFYEIYGFIPPAFVTISPGKQCNLKCPYCYANSAQDQEN